MPRLILLLAAIAVVYILLRRAQSVPPHKRRAEYIKMGLGVAAVVVVGLTLTGRMHWIGAALTGALVVLRQSLPALIRLFPMLAAMRGSNSAPSRDRVPRWKPRFCACNWITTAAIYRGRCSRATSRAGAWRKWTAATGRIAGLLSRTRQ